MRSFGRDLRSATAVGTALWLPLMMLEWRAYGAVEAGPGVLLALLWALPVAFTLLLHRSLRNPRGDQTPLGHAARTALQIGTMLVLAMAWVAVLADQMPCFLGIPNCD